MTTAVASYSTQEDQAIKYYISTFMVTRFLSHAEEQFYSENGKSPKNEKDLQALCTPQNKDMSSFVEEFEDKKNLYRAGKRNRKDLMGLFSEVSSVKTVPGPAGIISLAEERFSDNPYPSVIGFCDLQDPEQAKNCNRLDDSCPKAGERMLAAFKAFAHSTNALEFNAFTFCARLMKTWVQAQQKATSELGMCRQNSEPKESPALPKRT